MSLKWSDVKAYWSSNDVAYYIDDEGSKIPIQSEPEFEEALRFAQANGRRLKIILESNKAHSGNMFCSDDNMDIVMKQNEEDKGVQIDIVKKKKNKNHCEDCPPEWFTVYMKKFKKELMQELKLSIHETIHKELEKEKKISKSKPETSDLLCDEKSCVSSPVTRLKKKRNDKESGDQALEQRDVKLLKKFEKLLPSKFEKLELRLEKLDHKTRLLLEERKRLLEKKRHCKSKLDKKCSDIPDKKGLKPGKSAVFLGFQKMKLFTGSKFSVNVTIMNDGSASWVAPVLECVPGDGFVLNNKTVRHLPKLKPREMCNLFLEGTMTTIPGVYHLTCRVVDGIEDFGFQKVCRVDVVPFVPRVQNISSIPQPFEKMNNVRKEESVPTTVNDFINFEENVLTSSQKKIEENINEIEKRLHDIDLLRPSVSVELPPSKSNEDPLKAENPEKKECRVDFLMTGFDLLQNLESDKEKSCRTEEFPETSFVDSPQKDSVRDNTDKMEFSSNEKISSFDQYFDNYLINMLKKTKEQFEEIEKEKKERSKGDSDSELSIILLTDEDEDDDFIFVPVPLKTPSPAPDLSTEEKTEIVSEEKDSSEPKPEDLPKDSIPKTEDVPSVATEVKNEVKNEEVFSQPSCAKNRQSPFENTDFKTKKIKCSTEYHFTGSNLSQPIFSAHTDTGADGKQSCTFTFTGKINTEEEKPKEKKVPTNDSSGRVIFAVNADGYCLPVGSLFDNESGTSQRNSEKKKKNDKKSGKGEKSNQNRFHRCNGEASNEIPSVNILPNVFMNGASSMASLALNTAKSVINNLQSAFVAEGKTEMGKPATEQKKPNSVSMEAMFKLYEMGFGDLQTNRKLLLIHENNLGKVVEELILLQDKHSTQSDQEE